MTLCRYMQHNMHIFALTNMAPSIRSGHTSMWAMQCLEDIVDVYVHRRRCSVILLGFGFYFTREPVGEFSLYFFSYTGCPKNGVLMVHDGVEEITVNARKMLKKFYWTYLLIWRSLKVALNRSIILKYMYEIVMTATSNRTYYHKVQDHSLSISNPAL
jgi:hypothetical protein